MIGRKFPGVSKLGCALVLVGCGAAKPAPSTAVSQGSSPAASASTPVPSSSSPGPEAAPSRAPAPTSAPSLPATAASPPPLPSGTTLLHIGDSMAGALGIELNRALEQHGIKGILKYKTASFIPNWAWGEELGRYVERFHPDLVIISLGTNELEITEPERRGPQIERLVKRLGGLPCIWILPPVGPDFPQALPEVIKAHASPCVCVDNQQVFPSMPRIGDKVHPTMAARKQWAERLVQWLATHRKPRGERLWEIEAGPTTAASRSQ